jgi:hypothetical protein
MKKNFILLLLLTNFVFFHSATFGEEYFTCDTDSEGRIKVKDEAGGDVTSFALVTSPGVYDVGGSEDSCDITPDNYRITVYELAICKENPWVQPSGLSNNENVPNIDENGCVKIFSGNKEIIITPDGEVNLLEGSISLPIGSYPYLAIILDSHIGLKHIQEFINDDGSDATISGYQPTGSDTGTVCYTGLDVNGEEFWNTHTFETQSSNRTNLHGVPLAVNYSGTQPNARYRCGTLAEAKAGNAYSTTIINALGSREFEKNSGSWTPSNFRNYVENHTDVSWVTGSEMDIAPGEGIRSTFYLMNTDNSAAKSQEEARRIFAIQYFGNGATEINEGTIGFKLLFKTFNAINVRIYQEASADQELMATRMVANPFVIKVQTKTKRRTRAWR